MIQFPRMEKSQLTEINRTSFRIKFQVMVGLVTIINNKPSLNLRLRDAIVYPMINITNSIKLGNIVSPSSSSSSSTPIPIPQKKKKGKIIS